MTAWVETQEAADFIATANIRKTSPEIMRAIAFFARDLTEAQRLWDGDGFGEICRATDLWENVTGNGHRDPTDFHWGAAGANWWRDIEGLDS